MKARSTKNKKPAKQHVRSELASSLARMAVTKTPKAPLFNLPARDEMADMIRADMAKSRALWLAASTDPDDRARREATLFLTEYNDGGERLDFHSLRHTCGAWLVLAGISLNVVQQVMRHSTITLTIDTYGHLEPGATASAVESLKEIMAPPAATGTDQAAWETDGKNEMRTAACSVRDLRRKRTFLSPRTMPQGLLKWGLMRHHPYLVRRPARVPSQGLRTTC